MQTKIMTDGSSSTPKLNFTQQASLLFGCASIFLSCPQFLRILSFQLFIGYAFRPAQLVICFFALLTIAFAQYHPV